MSVELPRAQDPEVQTALERLAERFTTCVAVGCTEPVIMPGCVTVWPLCAKHYEEALWGTR